MQQSSSSIGSLAAALAKAQIELVNPEKSMVATIRADGAGRGEQIFRYAPLSSGLDVVRKTLGKTRDRCCAGNRDRSRGRNRSCHDPAVPFVWRMDRLGLASLPAR